MSVEPVLPTMNRGATCPHTGLSIPECSCRVCHLEQLRRHGPQLLDGRSPLLDLQAPIIRLDRYAGRAGLSVRQLRREAGQRKVIV